MYTEKINTETQQWVLCVLLHNNDFMSNPYRR